MADYCTFCETRRPAGGTNHLVLNGGAMWIEFCPSCGEKNVVRNEKGEAWLVRELFNALENGVESYVRNPMDVVKAESIAKAEDRNPFPQPHDSAPEEGWEEFHARLDREAAERAQLAKDYLDELDYEKLAR